MKPVCHWCVVVNTVFIRQLSYFLYFILYKFGKNNVILDVIMLNKVCFIGNMMAWLQTCP